MPSRRLDDELDDADPNEWAMRGDEARSYVLNAVEAVSDLVRATLGPRGLEKLIETQNPQGERELVLTNDSEEIIAAIERGEGFNHPVAALLIDSVDSVQRSLGDGGTTALLLTERLLGRGFDLVDQGIHPGTVVVGYAMAANRAGRVLDDLAREVDPDDGATLAAVASTSMPPDIEVDERERYAELIAAGVQGLVAASGAGRLNTDDLRVESYVGVTPELYEGVIVRRWPRGIEADEESAKYFDWQPAVPDPIEDATVALLDDEIDFEETAADLGTRNDERVTIGAEKLQAYQAGLEERTRAAAERLADMGVDVLVVQPKLDDDEIAPFENASVSVIAGAETPESDIYRLARASSGNVVSHLDDLTDEDLGTVGRVVEYRLDDEKWAFFDRCGGGIYSLVVDAPTETEAERRERIVDDAIEVAAQAATDRQVLPGAGAPGMAVAADLADFAPTVSGKEQLAIETFGDALVDVVGVLAANAGLDRTDAVTALRSAHANADAPPAPIGIDVDAGEPIDAWAAGIVEPRRVFSQAIETARMAAENLLTVDDVLYPNVDFSSYTPETEHH